MSDRTPWLLTEWLWLADPVLADPRVWLCESEPTVIELAAWVWPGSSPDDSATVAAPPVWPRVYVPPMPTPTRLTLFGRLKVVEPSPEP